MSKAKFQDISSQVFNGWTVLGDPKLIAPKGYFWLCQCICGRKKMVRECDLKSGHSKSCGCLRTQPKLSEPPICKCGEISNRKTSKGGWAKTCKSCYIKQKNHKRRPVYYLFNRAKVRAKKLGVPFSISKEDIVIPRVCPILGIELGLDNGIKERDSSPSLDRKIPELGYVKGNVAVISHLANRIKNTGTAEQHRRIAEWMEEEAA